MSEAARTGAANEHGKLSDELFRRYRETRDRRVRNDLIELHRGFAISVARRYADRGESLDDITQVAMLGLLKAVERYDPERGVRFVSFAEPTVAGEVKRHFRDTTWRVRVPRTDQELSKRARDRISSMSQTLGRTPTMSEVAAELDVEVDRLLAALEARQAYRPDSLDAPAADGEFTVGESLGAIDADLAATAGLLTLREYLGELPEREQTILRLRFEEEKSQSEIAALTGMSQMHVSRILRRTFRLLRSKLEDSD